MQGFTESNGDGVLDQHIHSNYQDGSASARTAFKCLRSKLDR